MNPPPKDLKSFSSLVQVVQTLRGPTGCPWDKEQTHTSLTRYAIEEAAELAEAIESQDSAAICEELGDVLLQVVLHAEIARQEGRFDIHDVIRGLNEKMIRRHPHVFGDKDLKTAGEVVSHWQELKKQEKANRPLSGGLPKELPGLIAAQKIGERTRSYRFDWDKISDVMAKVDEEMGELNETLSSGQRERQSAELGDVLFSLAQLARHLKLDAETSLRATNLRFEKRFLKMQELILKDGQDFKTMKSEVMEQYWQRAKSEVEK